MSAETGIRPAVAAALPFPKLRELPARPKRIVLHWTGGGPKANDVDREHYHRIAEQSGRIVAGVHGIAANMRRLVNGMSYAGHTGGFNSYSIGYAFAGMWKASPPTKWGEHPIRETQVAAGLRDVAAMCREYELDPENPAQLFTHAEAWRIHRVKGTQNHQKADILYLPWLTALRPDQVGPWLRTRTAHYLAAL